MTVAELLERGLSPRVRGKRRHTASGTSSNRSIPACAGEALASSSAAMARTVYPRVCGGSSSRSLLCVGLVGLSPRVRGKLIGRFRRIPQPRSIPACAGEAVDSGFGGGHHRVYPRVCGGSPRKRQVYYWAAGLSPRVRGKLVAHKRYPSSMRSIPACAGEARCPYQRLSGVGVYPRVCGGSLGAGHRVASSQGLSPRVRGKPIAADAAIGGGGSIPACAGEAGVGRWGLAVAGVYPRVCGGSSRYSGVGCWIPGLSPRVRGKPGVGLRVDALAGSIPACAGEAAQ